MKRFILALVMLSFLLLPAQSKADSWYIITSTHFIVYYKNASVGFIEELLKNAEEYYNDIADNLGFTRYKYWLWGNRAKIYIYEDAENYQSATHQPAWSAGCASIKDKIIYTYPYAKGFFDTILPHEIGHIIFREFVGFDNSAIPVWLDEGVACYQEKVRYVTANMLVKEAIEKDTFIGLEKLSRLNPHFIKEDESVKLFYAEAVSIVDYLVKEFGQDNFVLFLQALRDKSDLDKAINYAYPFKNIQELDEDWQEFLRK